MAGFESDYVNANDRGIFDESTKDGLRRLGVSHGVGDVSEGLKANIFAGASLVELGFTGTGKSQGKQAPSPETFGRDEREEMRLLAKINEVEISVHAAPNIGPLSGFDGRGRFDPALAQSRVNEVKKAIDFAADVASGGAVVVHTDEFPRPVFDVDRPGEYKHIEAEADGKKNKFQQFAEEGDKSVIYLVDERSGQIIDQVKRDEKIFTPEYDRYVEMKDNKGKVLMNDLTGEKRYLPLYKVDERGEIQFKTQTFAGYLESEQEKARAEGRELSEESVAKQFFREQKAKELERARGQADEYEIQFQQAKEVREKIEKSLGFYQKLKAETYKNFDKVTADEKWEEMKREVKTGNFIPPDTVDPIDFLEKEKNRVEKQMSYGAEVANAARQQLKEAEDLIKNRVVSLGEFGVKQAAKSYADAALYAYQVEQKRKDEGRPLDRNLFVAPEGWQTESYGSHPKEMRELIQESRQQMAEKLREKEGKDDYGNWKLSEKKALDIAQDHIQGTLDVGHINNWRKHFQGSDDQFNKWLVDNVKEMVKDKVIGNIHISDNFGYHDEHLRVGEGNAPIKELLQQLEKGGYKGHYVAEPGGQKQGQFHTAWTSALALSGSPIYRTDRSSRSWTDIQGSYFGGTPGPNYLVGEGVVPSKEFTLWSQVPLE